MKNGKKTSTFVLSTVPKIFAEVKSIEPLKMENWVQLTIIQDFGALW